MGIIKGNRIGRPGISIPYISILKSEYNYLGKASFTHQHPTDPGYSTYLRPSDFGSEAENIPTIEVIAANVRASVEVINSTANNSTNSFRLYAGSFDTDYETIQFVSKLVSGTYIFNFSRNFYKWFDGDKSNVFRQSGTNSDFRIGIQPNAYNPGDEYIFNIQLDIYYK